MLKSCCKLNLQQHLFLLDQVMYLYMYQVDKSSPLLLTRRFLGSLILSLIVILKLPDYSILKMLSLDEIKELFYCI